MHISVVGVPAKENVSVREFAREILTENLSGGLAAVGQQAGSMYSGLPQGMGFGVPQLGQLGSFGSMMSNYLVDSPQLSAVLRNVQQQMIDRFPRVIPTGRSAGVLYIADAGEASEGRHLDRRRSRKSVATEVRGTPGAGAGGRVGRSVDLWS